MKGIGDSPARHGLMTPWKFSSFFFFFNLTMLPYELICLLFPPFLKGGGLKIIESKFCLGNNVRDIIVSDFILELRGLRLREVIWFGKDAQPHLGGYNHRL